MVRQMMDGLVEFRFFRPNARQVSLAGQFNGWQPGILTMKKSDDGWWRCRLSLAPGCYEFRYFADGQWFTDYAAFGVEPTPFGWNSVVKVDPMVTERNEQVRESVPVGAEEEEEALQAA